MIYIKEKIKTRQYIKFNQKTNRIIRWWSQYNRNITILKIEVNILRNGKKGCKQKIQLNKGPCNFDVKEGN